MEVNGGASWPSRDKSLNSASPIPPTMMILRQLPQRAWRCSSVSSVSSARVSATTLAHSARLSGTRSRCSLSPSRNLSTSSSRSRTPIAVPTNPGSENPPNFKPAVEYEPIDRGLPYRRALLLFSIPVPPASWPSHAELMCPLFGSVQFALKSHKIGMNVVYDGHGNATDLRGVTSLPAELVFPDGRVYKWTQFSEATLDEASFLDATRYVASLPGPGIAGLGVRATQRIMVCTHGARDCRCSERGTPLVHSLRTAIASNSNSNATADSKSDTAADAAELADLEIVEIAHVGGHKWAANALLYPSLDMFSNLSADDADKFLRFIQSGGEQEKKMWEHWRGRIGYNDLVQMQLGLRVDRIVAESESATESREKANERKEEKKKEEEEEDGDSLDSTESAPTSSGSTATTRTKGNSARSAADPLSDPLSFDTLDPLSGLSDFSGLDTASTRLKYASSPTVPLTFTTFDNKPLSVSAPLGASLLEVARLNNLPGMEGTCGGNCECATCHLHFRPTWEEAPVQEPSEEEEDMLFTALEYRDGESRLGCQVRVTPELAEWNKDGGVLKLPQY